MWLYSGFIRSFLKLDNAQYSVRSFMLQAYFILDLELAQMLVAKEDSF
jgi:hypothetical protein